MNPINDEELFQSSLADEQPQPAAQPEGQPEQQGQARDERGRFAGEAPPAPEQPQAQQEAQPEQPQTDDHGDQPVPGKRFGEVTRARDEAIRRAEEAERRANETQALLQQVMSQSRQPAPQPQQQEQPDTFNMLLDNPEAFLGQRENAMLGAVGEALAKATPEGAKAYDEALQALATLKQQNPAAFAPAYTSIMNNHPLQQARALVDWHRTQQVQQRVGNDPEAFFARTLEERLSKDPEFAKTLVEKLTGQARQQPQAADGRPAIQLPPSLSRATAAAPNTGAGLTDMTDAAIFANSLR